MRHSLFALSALAVLSFGVAHAAPGFGSSSHRLGGDNKSTASSKTETASLLQLIAAFIKVEPAATVRSGKETDRKPGELDECEETKQAENKSKPSTKTSARDDAKARSAEPIYLAF